MAFFALGFRLSEHPPDRTGLDEARGPVRGQRERASLYTARNSWAKRIGVKTPSFRRDMAPRPAHIGKALHPPFIDHQ